METRHGFKYRQLHIEDYLREIPAEQGKERMTPLRNAGNMQTKGMYMQSIWTYSPALIRPATVSP